MTTIKELRMFLRSTPLSGIIFLIGVYGWMGYVWVHAWGICTSMGWPMCVHTFVDGNFFLPRTVHRLTQFDLMAFSLACLCDFLKQHPKILFFVYWAQRGVTLWQIYSNHQVPFMEHEQLLILFTANKRQRLGQTVWSYISSTVSASCSLQQQNWNYFCILQFVAHINYKDTKRKHKIYKEMRQNVSWIQTYS